MLIQMFLNQQEQLEKVSVDLHSLDTKMQAMMEQLILANKNCFGRSSEKIMKQKLFAIWTLRNQKLWKHHQNVRKNQKAKRLRICLTFHKPD